MVLKKTGFHKFTDEHGRYLGLEWTVGDGLLIIYEQTAKDGVMHEQQVAIPLAALSAVIEELASK